jgi:agmatine/peptidylarginine deiminase
MRRFPAEWEQQSAVLIAWPHHTGDFSQNLSAVEQSYSFIANTISHYQDLIIVYRDEAHLNHIENLLARNEKTGIGKIHFIQATVNDIWVRDTVFLTIEDNEQLRLLNFTFNGWGEKYPHNDDNALNSRLLKHNLFAQSRYSDSDFILEGGSLESDGIDTLLTTKQCLLNPNRNNTLTQEQISEQLQTHFGIKRILWIDQENLTGDDTDAHIDTLARFCTANTIAYTACDDEDNAHYASLKNMQAQLEALRTANNEPYQLIPLPLPKTIYDPDGIQLPANYSNFLIINNAVLVPVYDDANDAVALERLKAVFPERDIIATPCRPIVHQYGSLHCMTMQFPKGAIANA